MKKLIICAAALVTALFAGSCQRELLDPAQSGSTVTFAVEIPEVATKAEIVDNGKNINNLVYAVYRTDATSKAEAVTSIDPAKLVYRVNPKANNEVTAFVEGKTNVTLELINNQKYIVLFWAQVNQTWVAGTNFDLTNIAYPNKLTANQNKYEAFCGAAFVDEVTGATKKSVTLTRPFAQINLASSDPANYDVDIVSSSVKIENVYPSFNVATQKASGEFRTVEYATFDNPDGKFGDYDHYVAMNYIFANPKNDGTTPVKVTCTINTASHGLGIKKEISNVPVAQNYRTNIIGNLLTSEAEYTVELNDVWGQPETNIELWDGKTVSIPTVSAENQNVYVISHPNELAWLAAAVNGTLEEDYTRSTVAANDFAGKTFILTKDVDLANCEWSPIGSNGNIFKGTFDGQGHTVKNLVVNGGSESDKGLFGVTYDGEIKNLVVENAKVSGRLNVGVVAGTPYTSKYTNITVKGHVEVNGMAYVGGVGGKNAYADWTNVTVNVDETSYVKANSVENGTAYRTYVGGVVGFNGEGGHKFSNITSNINVEGTTCDVGGLFGIAHYGNQFENCVCTGDVTITTDEVENALEMGGIAGVWNNGGQDVVFTNCKFEGELLTPNITEEFDFYYGGLIGKPYSATGTGKLIIDCAVVVTSATELQAAVNAASGETKIKFGADIEGNVTVVQKQGVKINIEGEGHKFNGSIKVHSNSNHYADAALTIKKVNFETSVASLNFIEALENGAERYSTNITAEDCTFTATGDAINTAVGLQIKSSKWATVLNCTATNMHSLIQAQSCDETVVVNGCTINGKNGVAFKAVKAATVEGTKITAIGYGIRFDGDQTNYGITVKNGNNVTAAQPFIVRRMTGTNNTIALEGTNTLTTEAEYQIVITNGEDDAEYVKPTGTYTLTGADNFVVYPPIADYNDFLAKISDDTWYDYTKTELAIEDVADFAAFVETANSGNDFEGKTLKLTGDIDLYFEDVTAMADGDPVTFRPIGDTKYNGGKPFKGTFDGQGHTIKNLYQNGWDLGYEWGTYGSYGLFGSLDGATVKNVVIEGSESYIEGGDVSFIAGSATGNCVFENITINSGVAATYNNGCGGIIGWSGAGNYTFKNITIGKDAVLGGLWGSFDSSIGGIVGQAEPGATYNFENVTINCRIDAYNDCTASYDYYNYRMCGMIIGRCQETTTIDGRNYPDLSKYNMTFNNVVVNYGDWMNYHYCEPTPGHNGGRGMRVEPGYAYDGLPADYDHSQCVDNHMNWIPFNQLIGGDQIAVKGLPAVEGVTVNYPESFYREQGYKANGNTWTIYSGKGFKEIATTVLADGTKNVTIELAKDIDLAGIEWPAVKTAAAFVLDGKGYSIKNLTTSAVEDHGFYSTAMFTSTRKATTIKNLVVENATVTGKGGDNSHGAVLVACNYDALHIEDVTVKNSKVSNCDRSSVLVTYLYFTTATVKNCVVEGCTVNSIGTAGALLGMNNSHDFEATGNKVKGTTISSSEGSNKAGILIGTWQNAGTLTESGNVVENSKAVNAGTETNNNIGRHA